MEAEIMVVILLAEALVAGGALLPPLLSTGSIRTYGSESLQSNMLVEQLRIASRQQQQAYALGWVTAAIGVALGSLLAALLIMGAERDWAAIGALIGGGVDLVIGITARRLLKSATDRVDQLLRLMRS